MRLGTADAALLLIFSDFFFLPSFPPRVHRTVAIGPVIPVTAALFFGTTDWDGLIVFWPQRCLAAGDWHGGVLISISEEFICIQFLHLYYL